MLGKLIKHEWKSTCKMCGIIILVIAGMTLVGVLGFALPAGMEESVDSIEDSVMSVFWGMLMAVSMLLYVMTLMSASYAMLIYQGVHFYKTMYTDEGYLTQTLPVTSRQLLFSKALVAGIWNLLVAVSIGLSIVILIGAFISTVAPVGAWRELGEVWTEMQRELVEDQELARTLGFNMIHFCLSMLLMMILTPFCTIMTMFGALTIGQLSRKYKALIGILAYFGVMMAQSILMQLVSFLGTVVTMAMVDGGMNIFTTYDGSILVSLGMGVVMYFVAHYILTRKLNMD